MNPKGDGTWRWSLLARKIFTSLTLLQILSNCALAWVGVLTNEHKKSRSGLPGTTDLLDFC